MRRNPMNRQAIDDLAARKYLSRAACCGDDAYVVPRCSLLKRQCAHLRLDTPRTRQVAVTDVGDPHSGDRTPQWAHHDISPRL